MIKIKDLVQFDDKCLFDGAVQLEWIYNKDINEDVALSYVFHGPKYHGVKSNTVNNAYELIDTASFIKEVNDKLYVDNMSNRFTLAISSYGTGKSHLSVAMANLFSGGIDNELSKKIIAKIRYADNEIAEDIERNLKKKNLIIAINGGKDANLNSLVLKSAILALKKDGISEEILKDASSYIRKAKEFLEINYVKNPETYISLIMSKTGVELGNDKAKKYLLDNIDEQVWAFEVINEVYNITTGSSINVDGSFSAGEILSTLNTKLVVEMKIYNKIIIIFDEFGRFIEYAANSPTIAGDSALQQIHESVQNANKNILFIGFIQFDLETYMSRVLDNHNISKYIGRYKPAEKKYLSSNLETIFANLLKKNSSVFTSYVENTMNHGLSTTIQNMHANICRWINIIENKEVWSNYNLFNDVIVKGCYPFHPLSIWLLTNLSTWMQERSTINYLNNAYKSIEEEFVEVGKLNFIYPKQIITDEFIKELKGAEDKGLQQSNYCNLYYNIMTELKNKLSEEQVDVLKSVLITNILGIKAQDKNDLIKALQYCTGYKQERIIGILNELENTHAVIAFNPGYNTYDFALEANGMSEFNKVKLLRSRVRSNNEIIEFINQSDRLKQSLRLDKEEETDFCHDLISSTEWKFEKSIETIEELDKNSLQYYKNKVEKSGSGEINRGQLVFLYVNNANEKYLSDIVKYIDELELEKFPILFKIIDDKNKELINALNEYFNLATFDKNERQRFDKFYKNEVDKYAKLISKSFTIANNKKDYINKVGKVSNNETIKSNCITKLKEIYTTPVPFRFDGFDKVNKVQATKLHSEIIEGLISGSYKGENILNELKTEIANRIKTVLGNNSHNGWMCIDDIGQIGKPKYKIVNSIFKEIENQLNCEGKTNINVLFKKYILSPYGMNEYSLGLLIALFIHCYSGKINIFMNGNSKTKGEFIKLIYDKNKISFNKLIKAELMLSAEDKELVLDRIVKEGQLIKSVGECSDYLVNLESRIINIKIEDDYLEKIRFVTEKAREGQNKYLAITDNFNICEKLCDEFNIYRNDNIEEKLLSLNKIRVQYNAIISKSKTSPIYNFEQDERIKIINASIKMVLKDISENDIKNIIEIQQQKNYSEFLEFKSNLDQLVSTLRMFKCEKLSENLSSELTSLIFKKNNEEKNKELLLDIRTFISLNENIQIKSLVELNNIITQANSRISRVESSDMFKEEKLEKIKEIISLIDSVKKEILNRTQVLMKKIDDIYNISDEIKVEYDLKDIEQQNKVLCSDEIEVKIEEVKKLYKDLKVILIQINESDRSRLAEIKKNKNNKMFSNIIDKKILNKEYEWELKTEKWYNRVIKENKDNISTFNVNKLVNLKRELETYPSYIDDVIKNEASELLDIVNNKIKDKDIEGVVEMFAKLEKEQQKQCLYNIQKYLGIL